MNFTLCTRSHERLNFSMIRVLTPIFLDDGLGWGTDDLGCGNPPIQPCDLILESIYMNDDGDPGFNYRLSDSSDVHGGPELTGKDIVHLLRIKAIFIPNHGESLPYIPPKLCFDKSWQDKVGHEVARIASEKNFPDVTFEFVCDLDDIDLTVTDERHLIGSCNDYLLFLHVKEYELDLEWVCEIQPKFIVDDPYFGHEVTVYQDLADFEFNDSVYDVANDVSHDDIKAVVYKTSLGEIDNV